MSERKTNIGAYLPMVPEEVIGRAIERRKHLSDGDTKRVLRGYLKDKILVASLSQIEADLEDGVLFEWGRESFQSLTVLLGDEGYNFPQVTDIDIADTFVAQWKIFARSANKIIFSGDTFLKKKEQMGLLIKNGVLPIPDPGQYYDENPYLMDAIRDDSQFVVWGRMAVYELKRRQAIRNGVIGVRA